MINVQFGAVTSILSFSSIIFSIYNDSCRYIGAKLRYSSWIVDHAGKGGGDIFCLSSQSHNVIAFFRDLSYCTGRNAVYGVYIQHFGRLKR